MSHLVVAYRAGRQACADAKPLSTNPHEAGTPERDSWEAGWRAEYATLPEPLKAVRDAKEPA